MPGVRCQAGGSKKEGNQEPGIPAAQGCFAASPPQGPGPRVCCGSHPATCLGDSRSASHWAPSAKFLVLQVTHSGSLWGHLPHEISLLHLDPRRAPDGQGRKMRVGWKTPQTPQQPKTCPGIASMPHWHPARTPAPRGCLLLDATLPEVSQARLSTAPMPPHSSQSQALLER